MIPRDQLLETLTFIAVHAQSHSADSDAWPARSSSELNSMMSHVSHVMSCYLSQNTLHGGEGVESETFTQYLSGPVISECAWRAFLACYVDMYTFDDFGTYRNRAEMVYKDALAALLGDLSSRVRDALFNASSMLTDQCILPNSESEKLAEEIDDLLVRLAIEEKEKS